MHYYTQLVTREMNSEKLLSCTHTESVLQTYAVVK